ncbi:MAG: GTP-binding protein [Pseudomonadota bacterium]
MSAFSSAAVALDTPKDDATFEGIEQTNSSDRAQAYPDVGEAAGLGVGPQDSLRLLTCGSVDDGKSTLIGRLLWDASDLHEDQRAQLLAGNVTADGQPDFSRLVDGLAAEREQGITIDIAWRFFDTEARRYVIIDSPGHEQYTRNMASGASHADVAILLTDARHGIKRQTRRHAAILDLMGVRRVILAVNKMDLVDYAEDRYRHIENDFKALVARFGFDDAAAIPVAALGGDNVAARSDKMDWYRGPTLIERLNAAPARVSNDEGPFRFPVQSVLWDRKDFRGLAGTVSSGRVAVGDEVFDALSERSAKVKRIATMDGDLEIARKGHAVALELDTDLDIARGAVLSGRETKARPATRFNARLVWLSEEPYDLSSKYLLRTATDLVAIEQFDVQALLDLETLASGPSDYACSMNDIALAEIKLSRPTVVDRFADQTGVGTFMIVDALTGASVAGGTIAEINGDVLVDDIDANSGQRDALQLVLDEALLRSGLCADLGDSSDDRHELERRAREVAKILTAAGAAYSYRIG